MCMDTGTVTTYVGPLLAIMRNDNYTVASISLSGVDGLLISDTKGDIEWKTTFAWASKNR